MRVLVLLVLISLVAANPVSNPSSSGSSGSGSSVNQTTPSTTPSTTPPYRYRGVNITPMVMLVFAGIIFIFCGFCRASCKEEKSSQLPRYYSSGGESDEE